MTNINLVAANRVRAVGAPKVQKTLTAAEAITAGAPVRIDTAGKFTNANGTTTTEAAAYGAALGTVIAGEAVTAVREGMLDGYDLSGAYWSAVYLSDTDGRLGDSAGTVSTLVGRVVPAWGQPLGSAADKLLEVRFPD